MSTLNSVQLIGRLGADPEAKKLPSGETVSNFSLATSEKWTDKQSGEKKERTEWHRVGLFGRVAEVANQYLSKGDLIYIGGSIRTRKWQDKDGNDRYSTEIIGRDLKMLHTKGKGQAESAPPPAPAAPQSGPAPSQPDFDDEIPFSFAYLIPLGGLLAYVVGAMQTVFQV